MSLNPRVIISLYGGSILLIWTRWKHCERECTGVLTLPIFLAVFLTYTEARYKIIRDIITECSEILTYPTFLTDVFIEYHDLIY